MSVWPHSTNVVYLFSPHVLHVQVLAALNEPPKALKPPQSACETPWRAKLPGTFTPWTWGLQRLAQVTNSNLPTSASNAHQAIPCRGKLLLPICPEFLSMCYPYLAGPFTSLRRMKPLCRYECGLRTALSGPVTCQLLFTSFRGKRGDQLDPGTLLVLLPTPGPRCPIRFLSARLRTAIR